MATIQVMSDIHVEFFRHDFQRWFDGLDATGVDILVLAGDIDVGLRLYETLKAFCAKWPQVVFVAGNHEYYQSSPQEIRQLRELLCKELPNLTWLDNKPAIVDGVRFVGGTLWFRKAVDIPRHVQERMNDFHVIKDLEPWVYDENLRCEAILRGKAKDAHVVVTHHIPSHQGVAQRYKSDPLTHYFCHDLTDLIETAQPPVWIFGHTHTSFDFKIGESRLLCNPKGYPQEAKWSTFNPRCLFTVEV
jgi:Icc-related predicted phosphoesterase